MADNDYFEIQTALFSIRIGWKTAIGMGVLIAGIAALVHVLR